MSHPKEIDPELIDELSDRSRQLWEDMSEDERQELHSEEIQIMMTEIMRIYENSAHGFKFGVGDKLTGKEVLYHVKISKEIIKKGR